MRPLQLPSLLWLSIAAALAAVGFFGCSGGSDSPATPSPPAAAAFQVVPSSNSRFLQDQNGVPFPILGRTAWFITSLAVADYKTFIDDTVAKGFNAIEFHVVNHDPRGNNPPFGGNGTAPFSRQLDGTPWAGALSYSNINTDAPDFSTPNEAYWSHVDGLLDYAASKGVLCFLFPAYTGYQGGDQGWMAEMAANGPARMSAYGAFIAARYKDRGNIVWMLGGDFGTPPYDFSAPQLAVEQSLLAGMQSVTGQRSKNFSAEWTGESIYTDQLDPALRAAGTLQGAYSGVGYVANQALTGYAHAPAMPTFLLEEPYDQEGPDGNGVNSNATQPVRRFQWWGWLSGVGGFICGNGYVWPFTTGWTNHLNTQGAQDMARLNGFVKSIPWYNLVPSGMGGMSNLITAGGSTLFVPDYVTAAATADGTLLVAYLPPFHASSITVDMTRMPGPTRARWFDPTTATYTDAGLGPLPPGMQVFTPPTGVHVDGFDDWVLVLDKQ